MATDQTIPAASAPRLARKFARGPGLPACATLAGLLLTGALMPGGVLAQGAREQGTREAGPDRNVAKPAASRLEAIQKELDLARQRGEALEREATSLGTQRDELRKELIDRAARIQSNETGINEAEERLRKLSFEEAAINSELSEHHKVLADLLAGLQRLRRQPPPALAVRPHDALSAVRSAMLLGSVVPEVRAQALRLSESLARLKSVRDVLGEERRKLTLASTQLDADRQSMKRLLAAKQAASDQTAEEIARERKRMAELAREAGSLKELMVRLGPNIFATPDATAPPQAEPGGTGDLDTNKADRRAVIKTANLKPKLAFSRATGSLVLPVSGRLIRKFGAKNGFEGTSRGLSILTRENAQVTAPADGQVVFAGSFRGYGELLIINAGEGYHILLAGIERINVNVGQFVLAGEPVGNMGRVAAETVSTGDPSTEGQPVLYVEFRRNGDAIDPAPWWAETDGKVRS